MQRFLTVSRVRLSSLIAGVAATVGTVLRTTLSTAGTALRGTSLRSRSSARASSIRLDRRMSAPPALDLGDMALRYARALAQGPLAEALGCSCALERVDNVLRCVAH